MNKPDQQDLLDSDKSAEIIKCCDLSEELSQREAAEKLGTSQPLLNPFLKVRCDLESNALDNENLNRERSKKDMEFSAAMVKPVGVKFIWPQWIAGFGVSMLVMQMGFMAGWLSPTLARLLSPDSPLPLSSSQASWVASFSNVSRFFGAIVGAVLANWIGCKRTIFATLLPIALGWFCVIEATSVEWLYACRLFLGAGLGMMFSSFPTYVGEVSLPEIRGAIISSASVGSAFGTVVSSVCGPYLSLPAGSAIYFGLAVLLMFLFFWMPESPHHLMKVGDRKGAEKSIRWYRNGHEVEKELEAVEAFVKGSTDQSFLEKLMEFKTPPVRKATFQIIALFSFMQICGLNSIIFYMEIILRNAKFTLFDPASVVIYVNSAGILAAIVSLSLIDRCGRKFLIIISSLGVCISMGGLSSHFFFIDMGKDVSDLQWLPMAAMFLFVIAYFLGLMCVPSTILSETFPANIKCIAACIGSMTAALTSFISTKTYQPLVDTIGETYVFLMYSVCAAIVIPYTVFFMRETKGKTLMQIQEDLRGK